MEVAGVREEEEVAVVVVVSEVGDFEVVVEGFEDEEEVEVGDFEVVALEAEEEVADEDFCRANNLRACAKLYRFRLY